MGIFIRRMNKMGAKALSLQERGPKNKFERQILHGLKRAKLMLEDIYGVKIKKMPPIIVSSRMIFPDPETSMAYLESLRKRGQVSKLQYAKMADELKGKKSSSAWDLICKAVKKTMDHLSCSSVFWGFVTRPVYEQSLEAIRIPSKALLGPNIHRLDDILVHELIHHVLWEQKSAVYAPSKYSLSGQPASLGSLANEGLAVYLEQKWQPPPVLRSIEGLVGSFITCPITLMKRASQTWRLVRHYPAHYMLQNMRAFIFAATDLKKGTSVLARNIIWRKPEKFAKALDTHPIAWDAFDIYSDGLAFVKGVAKHLIDPRLTFRTISTYPPQTPEEAFMPERYLQRVQKHFSKRFQKHLSEALNKR